VDALVKDSAHFRTHRRCSKEALYARERGAQWSLKSPGVQDLAAAASPTPGKPGSCKSEPENYALSFKPLIVSSKA
jgi:hypothetical protein